MKTSSILLLGGFLLTTTLAGFSQPTISSLRLSGQAATIYDVSHLYASNSVSPGANLVFKATAGGTPPLQYQWQFNLSDLPGQTNFSLVLTNVQLTNAGDYTVVVRNAAGFNQADGNPDGRSDVHEKSRTKQFYSPTYQDVTRPVYTRSVGRWRAYEKYLAPILPALAPYCRRFGFA